jgi:hypothetical protein
MRNALFVLVVCCVPWSAHSFDLDYEANYNQPVRAQLLDQGDDGSVEREVQHWGFPSETAASFAEVVQGLRKFGFAAKASAGKNGVTFTHIVAVSGAEFDRVTGTLRDYFSLKGWTYDGWETVVVRKGNGS